MDIFDQRKALENMEVLVDTREQPTERSKKRYKSFGVPYRRATLTFGDYTYSTTINGKPLYESGKPITPRFCAVERKMDVDELAQCMTRSRDRFKAEFERARNAGARIYLVVENGSWECIRSGAYRTRVKPRAFLASCMAFMIRYNAQIIFCREESTGQLIKEILYRDLKERLENGEL